MFTSGSIFQAQTSNEAPDSEAELRLSFTGLLLHIHSYECKGSIFLNYK